MTAQLDAQRAAFDADPTDARAFETLEEHSFLNGQWEELVSLYRARLAAPDVEEHPARRVPLLFRLAQVLEERCLQPDEAVEHYWQAVRIDPRYRPALQQLRRIHSAREQWDMVLQIAEMEAELPMKPFERAAYHAELGELWRVHLTDPAQARGYFERALEDDANQQDALQGLARSLVQLGEHQAASDVWGRLAESIRGPDRAPILVEWAELLAGPLGQSERASELYRRALTDDPRNEQAVEALVILAGQQENWALLGDLFERRFDLAAGARRRSAIAVEAGLLQLERLQNPQLARMWFQRAQELTPDEPAVHHAIAELEAKAGNRDARLSALDRVAELSGAATPSGVLLSAAQLHAEQGDDEQALTQIRQLLERRPNDPELLDALSQSLARLDRHEELAEALERRAVVSDEPEAQAQTFAELGRLYEDALSDSDAASDAFAHAFALRPDLPGVATALERLLRKSEDWDALAPVLERASREGPESERAGFLCSIGEVHLERQDDPARAAAAFEAALDLEPTAQRALQGLSRIARDSGDPESAIRATEREAAAATDPARLAQLVFELVEHYGGRQQSDRAIAWIGRLLEAAPDDRVALETAAHHYGQLGQRGEQIAILERLDPMLEGMDQAEIRRQTAQLCLTEEREDDATLWFERAVASDPNDATSLRALRQLYGRAERADDHVRVMRQLVQHLSGDERAACLQELGTALADSQGDVEGAIVVLWQLAREPQAPAGTDEKLEELLERAGRHSELAERLAERRAALADGAPAARELDRRRARILLDDLSEFDQAAAVFRSLRAAAPDEAEFTDGLERALRSGHDVRGLVELLAERAQTTRDVSARAALLLERATLLEDALGDADGARQLYERLSAADVPTETREPAAERLARLLERSGDWSRLRELLEAGLEGTAPEAEWQARQRLAALCRDRQNDSEGCITHLEAAGRLRADHVPTWHSLALLYEASDRHADLLRVIEAELACEPEAQRETALRVRAADLAENVLGDVDRACVHHERVLQIDPGNTKACEFLVQFHTRAENHQDVRRLLGGRLAACRETMSPSERLSIRLRLAALCAGPLADVAAAIATLEPSLQELGPQSVVSEPLADLYERAERFAELESLCARVVETCEDEAERAYWYRRLGRARRGSGHAREAVEAYRRALADRPNDGDARGALCELYRELGDAAPLAQLLEEDLPQLAPADAEPVRIELAELLAGPLENPNAALAHLRDLLAEAPAHGQAHARALALAERLGRNEETLALIENRLGHESRAPERAALLERRAQLLAGPLGRPEESLAAYREALTLAPDHVDTRRALRSVLESLGQWPEVLDCLFVEARYASEDERASVYEQAAHIASVQVSANAALPWLERLRRERPDDASVIARIADIHRQAGRHTALLRALEDELGLATNPARKRDLHLERARVFERELRSPPRAVHALEEARAVAPDDPETLAELDRVYAALERHPERADVLEARLASTPAENRTELHRAAAELHAGPLADVRAAIPHWLRAVEAAGEEAESRPELLRELGDALSQAGQSAATARAAEAELRCLEERQQNAPERRSALHRRLRDLYGEALADAAASRHHGFALVELCRTRGDETGLDAAEVALLARLRADCDHVTLERVLATHLERRPNQPSLWLELARLREERLHQPLAAANAYARVLDGDPQSVPAIRGRRRVAERLGDWDALANSLERELSLPRTSDPGERAKLLRRLGDLLWHRLQRPDAAMRAYTQTLEADPQDMPAIRALEELHERRKEWPEAVAFCEREIEVLGESEPERRQFVWLHAGELARDALREPERALRAFEAAADIAPLPVSRRLQWSELYHQTDRLDRYAEVYASWLDDPESGAHGSDHLALVPVLERLDQPRPALARALRAIEVNAESTAAWDDAARLHETLGEPREAAEALERAA
ncbi:MAG: tetratricopeptide repeat protein, partial [Proteobacteria bacterium]|nr:tetratricopeptide repeat protein [Pseudomonadota bacterium]